MAHHTIGGNFVHHIANGVEAIIHRADIVFLAAAGHLVFHAVRNQEQEEVAALCLLGDVLQDVDTITADGFHDGGKLIPEDNETVSNPFVFDGLFNLGKPLADALRCEGDAHGVVERFLQLHIGLDVIGFKTGDYSLRCRGDVVQFIVLIDGVLGVTVVVLNILNGTFKIRLHYDITMTGCDQGVLNFAL